MEMICFIFQMLFVFQIKHFLADYPLQTPYMLGKFQSGIGFVKPLAAHCGVHAAFTFMIVMMWNAEEYDRLTVALLLAGFDFVIHFVMDRIKASPDMMGHWKALSASEYRQTVTAGAHWKKGAIRELAELKLRHNKYFWWALGFDQMVHHLTDYVIIFVMFLNKYGYVVHRVIQESGYAL